MLNVTWDVAADECPIDAVAGPGDCGRAETDGVPVRLWNGEPGLMRGVPGLEGVWAF